MRFCRLDEQIITRSVSDGLTKSFNTRRTFSKDILATAQVIENGQPQRLLLENGSVGVKQSVAKVTVSTSFNKAYFSEKSAPDAKFVNTLFPMSE